eukprot:scaffold236402_cov33-Tisochrysis_lutea.AAC.3
MLTFLRAVLGAVLQRTCPLCQPPMPEWCGAIVGGVRHGAVCDRMVCGFLACTCGSHAGQHRCVAHPDRWLEAVW